MLHWHFYTPWMAFLLPLPWILLKLLSQSKANENSPPEIIYPSVTRLRQAFPNFSAKESNSSKLFYCLLSLSWFFLVLALMQPEKVDQIIQVKNKGYDLMLAVDASGSMQAVDFSTNTKTVNRLDVVKEVVGKFVLGRQGDRVGLITFGESAYLHVPLTLDTLSVSKMLNDTMFGMAGNATAIGDAIGLSIKTLKERPEGSRVLVLLTDGADNSSRLAPLDAAKIAKQYGIKIYTIAVGKKGPVPFPNGFGGYSTVEIPTDEELLKEIANVTGGQFFSASNSRALESVYSQIDRLEKTESNENTYLIREPYYQFPLSLALIVILMISCIQISDRRGVYGF